jgi:hypothetical protein
MKITKEFIAILFIFGIISCQKDSKKAPTATPTSTIVESYSSVEDFFLKNEPKIQSYTVDGNTGGNFTTEQGTKVVIPPNAFTTLDGVPINGEIKIQFRDVYKRSDLVLSNRPTMTAAGMPLKTAGAFYFKATANNVYITLTSGKSVKVEQLASLTGGHDTTDNMKAYIQQDSATVDGTKNSVTTWTPTPFQSVTNSIFGYIYNLNKLFSPNSSPICHCSTSCPAYYNTPLTSLTLLTDADFTAYSPVAFLIFKDINAIVGVPRRTSDFKYDYAPQGLACTLAVFGVKDGVLYSYFKPFNIGLNQTLNFSLSPTTTEEFVNKLKTLN